MHKLVFTLAAGFFLLIVGCLGWVAASDAPVSQEPVVKNLSVEQ